MFWNQYAHSMRRLTSHAGCLAESWFQAIMFMLYTNASIHKENHFLHRLCISYQTWLKASDDSVKPSLPVSTPIHLCKYQLGSSSAALQAGQWSTSYLIGVRSDRRHHHLMRKAAAFLINRLTSPSSSARNFMHVSIDRPCHIGTCNFIIYIYVCIFFSSTVHAIFFLNLDDQFRRRQQALTLTAFTLVVCVQFFVLYIWCMNMASSSIWSNGCTWHCINITVKCTSIIWRARHGDLGSTHPT